MFVSPAYAQSIGAGGGSGLEALLPLILIFVVFYFLLIRPQQKKMKEHKDTLSAIRRGDKIVTGGGIIGTVSKVDDDLLLTVEIAKDVKVKVRRELVSTVLSKTEPAKAASATGSTVEKSGGFLSGLFGGGSKNTSVPDAANDSGDSDNQKPARPARKSKTPSKPEE